MSNDVEILIDTSKELIEIFDDWNNKLSNHPWWLADEIAVIIPKLKKIIEKIETDKIKEGKCTLNRE